MNEERTTISIQEAIELARQISARMRREEEQSRELEALRNACPECEDLRQELTELKSAAESANNLYLAEKDRYQSLYNELLVAQSRLEEIADLSNVGDLFDGHDELNEYTHEANEKLLTSALDRIFWIAMGKTD